MAQTDLDPMASMMALLEQIGTLPGVLDASLIKAHCWADVPDQGISSVVVADGDAPLAQREADRLAAAFWARRHEFSFSAETRPVDEAIKVAVEAPESTVYLSDSGDNATAGGSTDLTVVLSALLEQRAQDAVLAALWDPAAVEACIAAGVGRKVALSLGGKIDPQYGPPLDATGTVRTLSDGRYYRGGVRAPENRVERGPIAVWRVNGIDVVLSRARISIVEPAQLRSLGIEPRAYKLVVLKVGYLHAPFQAISSRSILMLSPGPTHCDVTQLPYRRVNRPIYPLDPGATWSPA
jgi:microcystin degradation protein MlrC